MMKSLSGCGPAMIGLAGILFVGAFCGGGYWVVDYTDRNMGSNGVFALLGILIGLPFTLIVLVLVAGLSLANQTIQTKAAQSNDGSLNTMLETFGKMTMLLKGQRSAPAEPLNQWSVSAPPSIDEQPADPVALLTAQPGWGQAEQPRIGKSFIIDR